MNDEIQVEVPKYLHKVFPALEGLTLEPEDNATVIGALKLMNHEKLKGKLPKFKSLVVILHAYLDYVGKTPELESTIDDLTEMFELIDEVLDYVTLMETKSEISLN